MAAVLFQLLKEAEGAECFSRMSVASHDPDHDNYQGGDTTGGYLLAYGTHATSVIPELAAIAHYFETEEKNFTEKLKIMKAKCVRETIRTIESSTHTPELTHLP